MATMNIAYADISTEAQSADAFTENILKPALNKILTLNKIAEVDQVQKTNIYDETIAPLFDYSLTSKLTLGKEQWEKLTDDQKERFVNLYGKRLQSFYLNRLLLLHPDTYIAFINTVQEQNKAVVTTEMESASYTRKQKRDVEYKLRYSGENWAIYDVDIAGVSILKNFKEQFKHLLSKKTIEDLLKTLEEPQ
jgi:phospholipid transport system substrate-binding protein